MVSEKVAEFFSGKRVSDYKYAIIVAGILIALGCVIALVPKTNVSASMTDAAKASETTSSIFENISDKIAPPADSLEEAVEKGLDVVEYDSMTEEEAAALGYSSYTFSDGTRVWYAKRGIYDLYAHDDGSMNEYEEGYFVAHSGSYYGGQIASLYPGATVNVNGQDVIIDGYIYDNYNTSNLWDVRSRVGFDKVCFQTCVDGAGNIIVYYGHYADGSTPNIARRQNNSSTKTETAAEKAEREAREEAAKQEAMRLAREKAAQAQAEAAAQKAAAEAEALANAQAAAEAAAAEKAAQAQAEAEAAAAAAAQQAAAEAAAQAAAEAAAQQAASNSSSNSSGSSSNGNANEG